MWCYDPSSETWSELKLQDDKKWPSGQLVVVGGNLFIFGIDDWYFASNVQQSAAASTFSLTAAEEAPEEESEDAVMPTPCYCGLVDLDKGTITKAEGNLNDIAGTEVVEPTTAIAVSSRSHGYIYMPNVDVPNQGWLMRLSYDAANNEMTFEDLTPSVKQVICDKLLPEFERAYGKDLIENHFTLAGLPDGVAIIGSPTTGEDTHIIKDGSTELTTFPRTSSYHQGHHMLGTYGDGYLYAMGNNATEPDVMYFRSTAYEADPEPEPTPTPEPEPQPAPEPEPTVKPSSARTASRLPKTGDESWYHTLLPFAAVGACSVLIGMKLRKRA